MIENSIKLPDFAAIRPDLNILIACLPPSLFLLFPSGGFVLTDAISPLKNGPGCRGAAGEIFALCHRISLRRPHRLHGLLDLCRYN